MQDYLFYNPPKTKVRDSLPPSRFSSHFGAWERKNLSIPSSKTPEGALGTIQEEQEGSLPFNKVILQGINRTRELEREKYWYHNNTNRTLMTVGTSDISNYRLSMVKYNFYRKENTRGEPDYENKYRWTPSTLAYYTHAAFYARTLIYQLTIPFFQNLFSSYLLGVFLLEMSLFLFQLTTLIKDCRKINRLSIIAKLIQNFVMSIFAFFVFLSDTMVHEEWQRLLSGEFLILLVILSLIFGYIFSLTLFFISIFEMLRLIIRGRKVINLMDSRLPKKFQDIKLIKRRGGNPKRMTRIKAAIASHLFKKMKVESKQSLPFVKLRNKEDR